MRIRGGGFRLRVPFWKSGGGKGEEVETGTEYGNS